MFTGSVFKNTVIFLIVCVVSVVFLVAAMCITFLMHIEKTLPSIESLKNYNPPTVTTIYASDGTVIAEFYHQRRYLVPFEQIPEHVKKAFLAAEDARFYEHPGVDIWGIMRAAIANIKARSIVQGGSTITQQVVKALLLTPERTWKRKLREAILAYKIDRALTKNQIFHIYLNHVYFGAGAYGVEAAARVYFNKHVDELSIAEAALLAGLPKAPSKFNPFENFSEARKRQLYVIRRMKEEHFITPEEAEKSINEKIQLSSNHAWTLEKLNHFVEHVRLKVIEKFGEQAFYESGFKIYTTFNPEAQKFAQEALIKGLKTYDKRHGFRGPKRIIEKEQFSEWQKEFTRRFKKLEKGSTVEALVVGCDRKTKTFEVLLGRCTGWLIPENWKWTRRSFSSIKKLLPAGAVIDVRLEKKVGDEWIVSLDQNPEVEGAIICVNPHTGEVLCMVGGKNFAESQFNRVTQPKRQPGSAFKPIIYSVAIEKGFTEASVLIDSPIIRPDPSLRGPWKPANYDGKFMGPITLRKALALSRNVVAIKLLDAVGIRDVISYARKMGITSRLTPTLSLALGASGVSLWELAHAYATFANGGKKPEFRCILSVQDRKGNIIYESRQQTTRVLSEETAYIITDMLKAVVREGTGRYALRLGKVAAGKTGTTNGFRDAWFMGYTPSILAGVWVGYDNFNRSLGRRETGGRVACPIWTEFMMKWLKEKPNEDFPVPPGIVFARATTDLKNNKIAYLPFKEGHVPRITSETHQAKEETSTEESIYKSELF